MALVLAAAREFLFIYFTFVPHFLFYCTMIIYIFTPVFPFSLPPHEGGHLRIISVGLGA